jgi:predicted metal-dependent hydrolase
VTDTTVPPSATAEAQTSSPGWTVPTRRVSFAERLDQLPRHFAQDGNLILSHLAAAFSTILPDGEAFYIESVRHYRDRITDPDLKRQIAGFIGQESVHGREHRELNERFAALGYPSKQFEWMVRQYMRLEGLRSPEAQLAHTAASEHITATIAEVFMLDAEVRASFGPVVGDICLWHCLEEAEHKAVAFDVYRLIGGSERKRLRAAKETRWSMPFAVAVFVVIGLIGDPATYRRGNLRRSWREFKAWPLLRKSFWTQLKDYERPGFHPNDRDITALVEDWRVQLFSDEGTLTPLLADSRR